MSRNNLPLRTLLFGVAFLLTVSAFAARHFMAGESEEQSLTTLHRVGRQSFTLTVSERGVVNPARISPISSEISSNQAKIIWLVKEGTEVRKGLLVARFDTKPFMDQLEKAEQDYADALATFQAAQKALAIQKEEEDGKIEASTRKLEIARVEAADIMEGSGPLKRKEIEQKRRQQERVLSIARLELEDFETLLEKGHISARERDTAKDKVSTVGEELEVTRAELKNFDSYVWPQMLSKAKLLVSGAESELQRVKRTAELLVQNRESEVEKNRRLVETKFKAVNKAKEDVVNCDIYAPASGILLYAELPRENGRRKIHIGDSVWVGQTFLQIPDTSDLVADIEVREVDVAKIDKNMPVELEMDAFPGGTFSGTVESISALALEDEDRSGVRKFRTRIRMTGDTGRIHVGMSVTAHILYRKVQDVPAIPIRGLHYLDGKTSVSLVRAGGPVETPVTVGARGSLWAEITNGLTEGDEIEIPLR